MKYVLTVLVVALTAGAQPPPAASLTAPGQARRGAPGRGGPPALNSPKVLSDRRVTFRLRAPNAAQVRVTGDLWLTQTTSDMTRGSDGVWSVTVGPLQPDIYGYSFVFDGVTMPDPSNGWIQPGVRSSLRSSLRVPGDQEAFLEVRPVPHGVVRMVYFKAESLGGKICRMHIYLPPGYDGGKTKYPVLYLIHGAGRTIPAGSTSAWPISSSTTALPNERPSR